MEVAEHAEQKRKFHVHLTDVINLQKIDSWHGYCNLIQRKSYWPYVWHNNVTDIMMPETFNTLTCAKDQQSEQRLVLLAKGC